MFSVLNTVVVINFRLCFKRSYPGLLFEPGSCGSLQEYCVTHLKKKKVFVQKVVSRKIKHIDVILLQMYL